MVSLKHVPTYTIRLSVSSSFFIWGWTFFSRPNIFRTFLSKIASFFPSLRVVYVCVPYLVSTYPIKSITYYRRVQPAHPKKQLFSVPVNKFTAKPAAPSPNLARIQSCLEEFRNHTPSRPAKIGPKALSMEDLTPNKRIRIERWCFYHTIIFGT